MVGGEGSENRNHSELNISEGESIRSLLQTLRYQTVCHLHTNTLSHINLLPYRSLHCFLSVCRVCYRRAESGAQMIDVAGRGPDQNFVLDSAGHLIQNQLQNLPVSLLQTKQRADVLPFMSHTQIVLYLNCMFQECKNTGHRVKNMVHK